MDIGNRLKEVREMYGLSQRELAKRVGLTNSSISMIERNSVSPSISSLKRILEGVSMSITDFFTLDIPKEPMLIFKQEDLVDIGSDGVELKFVGAQHAENQLGLLIETYQPGAGTGLEMLSHEGEEAGTVIEGEIEITIAGRVYHLNKGDSYKFATNLPHKFHNSGNAICKIISAHTPPTL